MDLTNEEDADWMARGREQLTDEERRELGYPVEDDEEDEEDDEATGDAADESGDDDPGE